MSELVVVGLLVTLVGLWIALPLMNRSVRVRDTDELQPSLDESGGRAVEEKQSIYRSLLDLELDHKLGKLEEEEYLRMRRQSEAEALAMIDATSVEGERIDQILEQEIRQARERLRRNR